jgi:two-component sensor histidine kinase
MILERVRRGENVDHYETVRRRKDGNLVDVSLTVSPIRNEQGEIVAASKIARDITENKRTQARQDLLLQEMDHRVKNLFALSISVLNLSGRSADSVPQLIESAESRLSALARAHALTLSHGRGNAPSAVGPTTLHSLIEAILAPYQGEEDRRRFSIVGCDMVISGPTISSLALLLHEFATNSVKYGAFFAPDGQIQIHCSDKAGTIVITWLEHGGPQVASPIGNEGFGDLLVRAAAEQLGGEISRDWRVEGLVIRLSVPRDRLIG